MAHEEWRDYPPCPLYQASNLGRIRSKDRYVTTKHGRAWHQKGRILAPATNKLGRVSVRLSENGRKWSVQVSHMVAEAFLGPREGRIVRHWNDDPSDNSVANLRYGTSADNSADAKRNGSPTGAAINAAKTHCNNGHPFYGPNLIVSFNGRACRACKRARSHIHYPKNAHLDLKATADEYFEKIMKGQD